MGDGGQGSPRDPIHDSNNGMREDGRAGVREEHHEGVLENMENDGVGVTPEMKRYHRV